MGSPSELSPQTRSTPAADEANAETRFCDRVARLLDAVDYRLANSSKERNAIFRLRYKAYRREGSIAPNSSGIFSDPYDETDNAYLFGLYIDDELASSIRIHVATREYPDFPSLKVFSDLMQPEVDSGKVIIDSTRFVTDEKFSRLHRGLPYVTLRLCWMAVHYFNADHFLAAIRAEHQPFYQRTFRHRLICGSRSYPLLTKPISLMTVHYPTVADEVHRRYPFFRSTLFERRMLFERAAPMPDFFQSPATTMATEWPAFAPLDSVGAVAPRSVADTERGRDRCSDESRPRWHRPTIKARPTSQRP